MGLQAALRQSVPEIDYVDLRFGERVYVGPVTPVTVSGGERPAPAAPEKDAGAKPQR